METFKPSVTSPGYEGLVLICIEKLEYINCKIIFVFYYYLIRNLTRLFFKYAAGNTNTYWYLTSFFFIIISYTPITAVMQCNFRTAIMRGVLKLNCMDLPSTALLLQRIKLYSYKNMGFKFKFILIELTKIWS